jgi:hypothetical protein
MRKLDKMYSPNQCRLLLTLSLLCTLTLLNCLFLPVISEAQQPPLEITSPASGTIVSPGQTLSVYVTSPAGLTFSLVDVIARYPIGMSATATTPGLFTLTIPADMKSGPQLLNSEGITTAGQDVESAVITIDIERTDTPILLTSSPSKLGLESQGETFPLKIFGTFSDGTVLDVSLSSHLTFSSSNSAVATVDASGNVTAVAAGNDVLTITYTLGSQTYPFSIPVDVQHPMLTTSPSSLVFPSQNIGTTSSAQQILITNVISNPVSVLSVNATGDFSESDNCLALSPTLAPHGVCTVNVSFSPTLVGSETGSLFIANSANIVPIAIALSGTGATPPPPSITSLSPTSGAVGAVVTISGSN